jgi:hypothetical protein
MKPALASKPRRIAVGIAIFLLIAILFEIANRGAYRGFFHDDDLTNIPVFGRTQPDFFLKRLVGPQFEEWNFRPAAAFFFWIMYRVAGIDHSRYIAAIHAMHLLNVVLLFFLLRRLKFSNFAAAAGALLFAFHMAAYDVYSRPMYVFDLEAAMFTIACLLAYTSGWTITSVLLFWLAYRSKEVVIFLPLALAAYEYWLGERKWLRLIPFFAISANFGLQAVYINSKRPPSDYSLRFDPASVWTAVRFYTREWLQSPLGLALLAIPFFWRDRRFWFGLLTLVVLTGPVFFLPARLYAAYVYTGLAGLAICLASFADAKWGKPAIALFFLIWIPWNYAILRDKRKAWIAESDVRRQWFETVREPLLQLDSSIRTIVLQETIPLAPHGVSGAFSLIRPNNQFEFKVQGEAVAQKVFDTPTFAFVGWDPQTRRAVLTTAANNSYYTVNAVEPFWLLGSGWHPRADNYRWSFPVATATLDRPANATTFEVTANISPDYLNRIGGRARLEVRIDDRIAGICDYRMAGWQTNSFQIPAAPAGRAAIEFRVEPWFRPNGDDKVVMGVPLGGFGFK